MAPKTAKKQRAASPSPKRGRPKGPSTPKSPRGAKSRSPTPKSPRTKSPKKTTPKKVKAEEPPSTPRSTGSTPRDSPPRASSPGKDEVIPSTFYRHLSKYARNSTLYAIIVLLAALAIGMAVAAWGTDWKNMKPLWLPSVSSFSDLYPRATIDQIHQQWGPAGKKPL